MSHLEIEPAPVGAGCSNPIIGGGGALVYPSIHSPNFSAGPPVTGWTINKDGSFSFGAGGSITGPLKIYNSHGAVIFEVEPSKDAWFLYADTGSAAQGALIASGASASGTDDFGNAFNAGINEYVTISGTRWAVTLAQSVAAFGGTLAGVAIENMSVPWATPASVAGLETGGGANLELSSGLQTAGGQQSAIILRDSVAGGNAGGLTVVNAGVFTVQTPVTGLGLNVGAQVINDANGVAQCRLQYAVLEDQSTTPPASILGPVLYGDSAGALACVETSGLAGRVEVGGQTQLATNNVTGATGTLASATINASDAEAGSVYELIAFGSGNVGVTPAAMQFGCLVNGAVQGVARGTAAAAIAASQAFRWQAKVILLFRTVGNPGTALVNGSWIGEQTANDAVPGTAADWSIACAFGASTTFNPNTTAAITLGLQVATGGTVSIDCIGAYLKRVA